MLAIIFFIIIPLVLFFYFKWKKRYIFLVFVGLLVFYYTPYSFYLEPSFHEFKNMCKLNKLPNDEEKYNKILSHFDTDLESLDWEELNEKVLRLIKGVNSDYVEGKLEYRVRIATIQKKRYNISVDLYANNKGFSKDNITYIQTYGTWHTNRYFLEQESMASYNLVWSEKELICANVAPLKYDYAERIK